MVFSTLSWFEVRSAQASLGVNNNFDSVKAANEKIARQRKKLFRIALMTCACLLLNMAMTIGISVSLEEWAESENQKLDCSFHESLSLC